jgi:hypothetical protein
MFPASYWGPSYWGASYWGAASTVTTASPGVFWGSSYWGSSYWLGAHRNDVRPPPSAADKFIANNRAAEAAVRPQVARQRQGRLDGRAGGGGGTGGPRGRRKGVITIDPLWRELASSTPSGGAKGR